MIKDIGKYLGMLGSSESYTIHDYIDKSIEYHKNGDALDLDRKQPPSYIKYRGCSIYTFFDHSSGEFYAKAEYVGKAGDPFARDVLEHIRGICREIPVIPSTVSYNYYLRSEFPSLLNMIDTCLNGNYYQIHIASKRVGTLKYFLQSGGSIEFLDIFHVSTTNTILFALELTVPYNEDDCISNIVDFLRLYMPQPDNSLKIVTI